MQERSDSADGKVPDKAPAALLLIDVINDLEFEGGEALLPHALEASERIAALKERLAALGIPTIYVNDNFGQWQSDFRKQVRHVLEDGVRGEPIARRLAPEEDDYFVLKPLHSGFYSTTLETLLEYLGARTLIIAGFAADICVLFTANDAYMRGFRVVVPADCVASNDPQDKANVLALMERVLHAETTSSDELDLEALVKEEQDADE